VKILVVDVGGSHIKALATGHKTPVKIPSGPDLTPRLMLRRVLAAVKDWRYDAVALGYPGAVVNGKPISEPRNLGSGWVGFNFKKAFGCPVKVVNDAAMQALGCYRRGRMLFLGLGTGLGSALVVDGVLEPMELAHLPYKNGRTYEQCVGKKGLKRLGKKKWRRNVTDVIERFRAALNVDEVVVGGGNAKLLKKLPKGARRVTNANAFVGGFRLWEASR
jgi:predicted NBD/HSP70 family sugar kinase